MNQSALSALLTGKEVSPLEYIICPVSNYKVHMNRCRQMAFPRSWKKP